MNENDVIAESENFIVWCGAEEGEMVYHIELGGLTLHLDAEEWDELVTLFKSVA